MYKVAAATVPLRAVPGLWVRCGVRRIFTLEHDDVNRLVAFFALPFFTF